LLAASGYVTLFAASFPLASLFAMMNNILEIRSDAWLLCRAHQRPIWKTQEDIGSWASVIFFISIINTVVNAAITAFVGAQLDDTNGTFTTRIRRADLWMIAVLIEHCVLACKFLVKVILPEEPEWVATAKAAVEYRQDQIEGPESLMPRSVQKRRLAADKAAQIHNSRADEMHSLLVAWHKADEDNSGTLDLSEFTELVAHSQFCQDVTTEEVKALYERVDTDGDGQIDRRELEAWERNEREREKMKREETMLNTEQQLADWEEEQRQLDMAQNGNGVHYDMEQPEPEPEENTTQV
jgi:Ca2+-binding EF-hand superfamily protein